MNILPSLIPDLFSSTTNLHLFTITVAATKSQDLYKLLDISKTASKKEIKKAFRKMAQKYHPDKNKEKDAEKKFMEIARAYEILSDDKKRAQYDKFGEAAFTNGDAGAGGGGGDDHGGFYHGPSFTFNDFFHEFDSFRQHHGQHHHHHHHQQQGGHFHNMFNFDDLFNDDDFGGGAGGAHNHFGSFDSFFDNDNGDFYQHVQHSSSHSKSQSQTCRTVTKRTGNTVMTHTECH